MARGFSGARGMSSNSIMPATPKGSFSRISCASALLEAFISYEPYAFMIRRGDASFRFTVDRILIRLYRSAEVVPIYEKWFGPFPEGTSMIAALYVLNSVPE